MEKSGTSSARGTVSTRLGLEQTAPQPLGIGRPLARTGLFFIRLINSLGWGRPLFSTKVGLLKAEKLSGLCMNFVLRVHFLLLQTHLQRYEREQHLSFYFSIILHCKCLCKYPVKLLKILLLFIVLINLLVMD